jgi:signal transduction histidine kinase
MVFANAACLAVLGIAYSSAVAPRLKPAAPQPGEMLMYLRLLGVTAGGVGLGLLALGRLASRDRKRIALVLLLVNMEVAGLYFGSFLYSAPRWGEAFVKTKVAVALVFHAIPFLGIVAAIVWKHGEKLQSVSRLLLAFQASLALLCGYALALKADAVAKAASAPAPLLFLGGEAIALALLLAFVGSRTDADDRRRLLLGLGAGNALGAALTLAQHQILWGSGGWRWSVLLLQGSLAAGSIWLGLRPEARTSRERTWALTGAQLLGGAPAAGIGPGDSGLETEETRQAWLRQVSEAAAQEERNRLARDLHDSIKQQIFSIHVSAAAAQARWETDPGGARAAVADVRRCAQEAMVEMRALLQQLRPQALAGTGLVEALREQCEALGYRTGAEVSLELGDPIPDDRLPAGAQEMIFRIAQEALGNVARHARARHVHVRLGRQEDAVLLQVEDDGQGFTPGVESSGMGLRNLRERTELLRGDLEVVSSSGTGTRIAVRVPLAPVAAPGNLSLAKAVRAQTVSLWIWTPMVFLYARIPFGITRQNSKFDLLMHLFICSAIAAASWSTRRSAQRRFPEAGLPEISRFLYGAHRGRTVLFLGSLWIAYQGLRPSGEWRTFSLSCVALFLVLAVLEMAGAYRRSRPLRLPAVRWGWPAGWERFGSPYGFLLGIAAVLTVPLVGIGRELLSPLDPSLLLFCASWMAVGAFFLWRRPRTEGASS